MYTVVKKTEGKVRIINDQKTATNFITKDITSHSTVLPIPKCADRVVA